MMVPAHVAYRFMMEGGCIEANRRGGVLWQRGQPVEVWGDMRQLMGRS